jgi:hypothetical protein
MNPLDDISLYSFQFDEFSDQICSKIKSGTSGFDGSHSPILRAIIDIEFLFIVESANDFRLDR